MLTPCAIPRSSYLAPAETSLTLRIAVDRRGVFQLGTLSDFVEEHLLVLSLRGGIENYRDFDGRILPLEAYETPRNELLETGARQNLLAQWFAGVYEALYHRGLLAGGPANRAELHACPIRVHQFFGQPIRVLTAALYHQQFDFGGITDSERAIDEAMNAAWSPIAAEPDQDAVLRLRMDLQCERGQPSVLHIAAASDNGNSTYFGVTGVRSASGLRHRVAGDSSEVMWDAPQQRCMGVNHGSCQAIAILYDAAPRQVELKAVTTWSSVQPRFRYVTLGEAAVRRTVVDPSVLDGREIEPLAWVLPPE